MEFKTGQVITVEQAHLFKKEFLKVKEALGFNKIIVSQTISDRGDFSLRPEETIKIFVDVPPSDDEWAIGLWSTCVFEGVLKILENSDAERWKAAAGENLYSIEGIVLKQKHPKRKNERIKVKKVEAEIVRNDFSGRWKGVVLDINQGGFKMVVEGISPRIGTEVFVALNLEGNQVMGEGKVKGVSNLDSDALSGTGLGAGSGVSVKMTKISDADSGTLSEYIKKKRSS